MLTQKKNETFGSFRNNAYLCSMNARREKAKQQNNQTNKEVIYYANPHKDKDASPWKENLGKYLIDISKYVVTGVIITSMFRDINDKSLIYILGVIVALIALIVGLILTNKKKG